jgi:hypothetical protein
MQALNREVGVCGRSTKLREVFVLRGAADGAAPPLLGGRFLEPQHQTLNPEVFF